MSDIYESIVEILTTSERAGSNSLTRELFENSILETVRRKSEDSENSQVRLGIEQELRAYMMSKMESSPNAHENIPSTNKVSENGTVINASIPSEGPEDILQPELFKVRSRKVVADNVRNNEQHKMETVLGKHSKSKKKKHSRSRSRSVSKKRKKHQKDSKEKPTDKENYKAKKSESRNTARSKSREKKRRRSKSPRQRKHSRSLSHDNGSSRLKSSRNRKKTHDKKEKRRSVSKNNSRSKSVEKEKRSRSKSAKKTRKAHSKSRDQRKSRSKSPVCLKNKSNSPTRSRKKSHSSDNQNKTESATIQKIISSTDRRKSKSRSPRHQRSRSKTPIRRRRHSKSRSPVNRKRSRSKTPIRRRRTKSRSPVHRKRSRSKSPFRRRSKSRSPVRRRRRSKSPVLRRSKSRSPVRRRRRRSRSRSPVRRHSRSKSTVRRRSRSRSHPRRRSRSRGTRRSRSRSQSHEKKPHSRSLSKSRRSGSKGKSSKDLKTDENLINKEELRRIALENVVRNIHKASALDSNPNFTFEELNRLQKSGISVHELSEVWRNLAAKQAEEASARPAPVQPIVPIIKTINRPIGIVNPNTDAVVRHPFQMKPAESEFPKSWHSTKRDDPSQLMLEFPVSAGVNHSTKEASPVTENKVITIPTPKSPPSIGKWNSITTDSVSSDTVTVTSALSQIPSNNEPTESKGIPPPPPPPTEPPKEIPIEPFMSEIQQLAQSLQQKPVLGRFTGETVIRPMSHEEHKMGYQAWVKKDVFISAPVVRGGFGQLMLKKMGWNEGEGLGKNREGAIAPIMPDFKTDRRGLASHGESATKKGVGGHIKKMINSNKAGPAPVDLLSGKHPISVLNEYCKKAGLFQPDFTCVDESGPAHCRSFLFCVRVNGVEYTPGTSSKNKKEARAASAFFALEQIGLILKSSVS